MSKKDHYKRVIDNVAIACEDYADDEIAAALAVHDRHRTRLLKSLLKVLPPSQIYQ